MAVSKFTHPLEKSPLKALPAEPGETRIIMARKMAVMSTGKKSSVENIEKHWGRALNCLADQGKKTARQKAGRLGWRVCRGSA
ncbi:MAG: hypothetical protein JEZ11_01150 [Desulfobacterales bacterium]|nr:hypothetical protein [Desulfobacterales bacterium]